MLAWFRLTENDTSYGLYSWMSEVGVFLFTCQLRGSDYNLGLSSKAWLYIAKRLGHCLREEYNSQESSENSIKK